MSELPEGMARALEALDARAARRAAAVDPERVAQRVMARLASEPEAPAAGRWSGRAAWTRRLAVAAALTVLGLTATLVAVRLTPGPTGAESGLTLPVLLRGADSLSQAQADAVLDAIEDARAVNEVTPRASTISVQDLSETELRALLQAMESSEGSL